MKPLEIKEIRKQRVTKEGILFLSLAMKIMWLYRTNRRKACFNMASDNTRKLMLAKVLKSARAANILDENVSDGVRGLIADYFATVPAVEEGDTVDGEDESDQDNIEMVSKSRRDMKTSNGDSEENCDIESSGGCADNSEDSISDDEGLADYSVSQFQTDIQDNMTELWHRVAESSKLSVQVQIQSTSLWDVNSSTLRKTWMHSTVFHGWNLGQETKHGRI